MAPPLTMFEKIWAAHEVHRDEDGQSLLYVDRHFIHDGSRTPYKQLADRGLAVRRPDLTFATPDHYVPTTSRNFADVDGEDRKDMVASLTRNTQASGVTEFGMGDVRHGIVHVMGPEQGLSLPSMLILCGDSHTSTHGALGARRQRPPRPARTSRCVASRASPPRRVPLDATCTSTARSPCSSKSPA